MEIVSSKFGSTPIFGNLHVRCIMRRKWCQLDVLYHVFSSRVGWETAFNSFVLFTASLPALLESRTDCVKPEYLILNIKQIVHNS